MSQENVDVAKQCIDAFNARQVDAFTALTTPDFVWSPSMVAVEGEVFEGSDGIRRYFDSLSSAWERFLIVPDSFREVPSVVVMLGRLSGHGKNSGVPVDASLGMVFDLHDGRIARIRGFLDHAEALQAANLDSES